MHFRYIRRVLKWVFVVSTVGFVLAHLHYRTTSGGGLPDDSRTKTARGAAIGLPIHQYDLSKDENIELDPQMLTDIRRGLLLNKSTSGTTVRRSATLMGMGFGRLNRVVKTKIEPHEIRQSIEFNNAHAEVRNEEKFGAAGTASTVIVVQVHNRPAYLKMLVESLGNSRHIEDTLLIFSHDYFSQEINDIVRKIDFCRVIQIFYPYSIQVFPRQFPGEDPNDCPSTASKETVMRSNCLNKDHPDKYGHYRVAKLTQIKHHWWWKSNYVFEMIPAIRNYTGWVLYLEEDHFVSPDFLHVLNYVHKNRERLCSECEVISLGVYLKSYGSYATNLDRLAVYPWFSSRHNMGMALNRAIWDKIRHCSQLFCSYDDYNWDWSLMKVNMQCLKTRLKVVYAKAPRVFHIGDCGVHHKCKASTSADKFTELLSASAAGLFPASLAVSERSKRMLKPPKENGGWGDIRDHQLCHNNTFGPIPSPFVA